MSSPTPSLRRRRLLGLVAAFAALPGCVSGGDTTVSGGDRPSTAPLRRPPQPAIGPFAGSDTATSDSATGQPMPNVGTGVSGFVRDRAGRPVAQAFVQASGAGPGDPPVPEMAVFSDARGFWHWSLQPGNYVLSVSSAGRSAQRRVQVRPGQTVPVELILD